MPTGSDSKARTAAALSPSTSMMSMDGAPRANEISCWAVMPAMLRSSGFRRSRLGPYLENVPYRDHPEPVSGAEHHQVPEAAPYHRAGRLLQRPVRGGVHDVPGQMATGPFGVGIQ